MKQIKEIFLEGESPTLNMQNCFKYLLLLIEKVIYTLGKAFGLIDKWLEESCDDSESETEVSGNSDSCFSYESDTETIDSVAPD